MRWSLFGEILSMSWDTVRGNKLRSFLTVLGIVIGITSIVGMTSLIRGFDQSFRDLIKGLGPNTIYVAKFSGVSVSSGARFQDLLKRPNITPDDAEAIERDAPSIEIGRHHARRRRSRRQPDGAHLLPQSAHQAVGGLRHDGQVAVRRAAAGRERTVLHRRRSPAARPRRGPRPDAGRGAVSRTAIRSARAYGSGSRSTRSSA